MGRTQCEYDPSGSLQLTSKEIGPIRTSPFQDRRLEVGSDWIAVPGTPTDPETRYVPRTHLYRVGIRRGDIISGFLMVGYMLLLLSGFIL